MGRALMGILVGISVLMMGIPLWVLRDYSGSAEKAGYDSPMVRVLDKKTGKTMNLPVDEYLAGVVAAEMPANFDVEALKAQAVAARTYTLRRMFAHGAKPVDGHGGAEICTDPVHCQAWADNREMAAKWGRLKYYVNMEKIRRAVRTTKGQVLTYNNALIDPVYHASCGGRGTESAGDVWSGEIPYLRGVECNNEYRVQDQVYNVETSRQDALVALKRLGLKPAAAIMKTGQFIDTVRKSVRGRLLEVGLFGCEISGSQFRQAFGLTSTLVTWRVAADKISLTSVGKGHAVGLCQYGANGMALAGSDYRAILCHYYTGVKLQILQY